MITNLIPALGWTLLHSLWQGALLFLVVVPLLAALHNKSSQLRYGVVCTALLLLLGGMGLTFGALLEFTPTSASPSSATLVSILPVNDNATAAVIATETAAVSSFTSSPTKEAFSFTRFLEENVTYLVAIWGLGVLGFALRWFSLLLLTLRLRTRGVRRLSADWQQRLRQLSLRMNVRQQVGLLESDQVDTPLVIGWIKPVILLPVGLVSGLTIAQVESILAHELAHISRRDFLVNLFFTSLEVVLFYHPFYWWIMTKINEEREQCCDDVAVAACGNPRMYAYTLLSVEEHRQSGMFAMAFARKGGQLQQRIQRICQVTPRYGQSLSLRFWLLLPLLAFVAAFTYAGTYPDRVGEKAFAEQEAVGETEELTPPEVPVATATFLPALPAQEEPLYTITPETVVDRLPNAGRLVVPLAQMDLPAVVIVHEPVGRSKRVVRLDSLPRPVIPTMAAEPELPAAPTFSLSGDEVAKLLDGGDAERTKLREATTGFRDQINDWNERVNEEYLEVWGDHRERIMDAYAG
ncbi:MAG: M56 family metallopeptidase, partial [Bacteroidota bacterium]